MKGKREKNEKYLMLGVVFLNIVLFLRHLKRSKRMCQNFYILLWY